MLYSGTDPESYITEYGKMSPSDENRGLRVEAERLRQGQPHVLQRH